MNRSLQPEIMDDPRLPDDLIALTHKNLTRLHRWLGDTAAILRELRRDRMPVRRVLDVGCGCGGLLIEIRKRIQAEVVGVDLRAPAIRSLAVSIIQGDAVRDPLPPSDIAIAVCLAHHLSEAELIQLIRNVGRSCRRFILLDPVRHRLPLLLFRLLVAPFLDSVTALDGSQSIRRSYTPSELKSVVRRALAGTTARFRHKVAAFYTRQIVDIRYIN